MPTKLFHKWANGQKVVTDFDENDRKKASALCAKALFRESILGLDFDGSVDLGAELHRSERDSRDANGGAREHEGFDEGLLDDGVHVSFLSRGFSI